jgi:uncharacterized repeat protein (TIGR01451 family)
MMGSTFPPARRRRFRRARLALIAVAALALLSVSGAAATTAWQIGDVFAGVASGQYKVYDNGGVFKETITDGLGGFTTGCSFNPALDKLYTTNFSSSKVVVYDDASPHAIVQTITTGKSAAESIVFASNGHFFVGGPSDGKIEEYTAAGTLVDTDTVAADGTGGPDWIDLAADQKTMYYASEGRLVKRYDVSADTQLTDFATLPGSGEAFALRLLAPGDGSGGLLVADGSNVKRLDGSGTVVQTYDVAGEDDWFSLNLDPNGTSFWAGDFGTNNFYRFNISTGAVEVGPIASGGSLFGLCLKGEITAAVGNIALTPATAQNVAGTSHTVTATITSGGNPVPGELVSFSVTAGPNTGQVSDPGECSANTNCTSDANGMVSWTYTSNGSAGTDAIQACFDDNGVTKCATASKEWTPAPDLKITKAGPANGVVGGQLSYTLTVKNNGPSNATNVVVGDPVPAGTTFVSATASQGTCDATVSCNLGNLASGDTATVTIVVTATTVGTVTNTATVSASEPDPDTSNNSSTATTEVYGFAPGGGSFVVGDKSATGAVTFWGAQWWKLNALSGGAAPAAFKGFALNPAVPACGTGWSTDPGNSAPPPAGPLPAYMAVIVSSAVTQSGSQISGDTAHIVIVKTNPGYDANPGHAGTGTFFASIC